MGRDSHGAPNLEPTRTSSSPPDQVIRPDCGLRGPEQARQTTLHRIVAIVRGEQSRNAELNRRRKAPRTRCRLHPRGRIGGRLRLRLRGLSSTHSGVGSISFAQDPHYYRNRSFTALTKMSDESSSETRHAQRSRPSARRSSLSVRHCSWSSVGVIVKRPSSRVAQSIGSSCDFNGS